MSRMQSIRRSFRQSLKRLNVRHSMRGTQSMQRSYRPSNFVRTGSARPSVAKSRRGAGGAAAAATLTPPPKRDLIKTLTFTAPCHIAGNHDVETYKTLYMFVHCVYRICHESRITCTYYSLLLLSFFLYLKSVPIHVIVHVQYMHPRQLIFLRKSDCLGVVLLCLVVCMTLLASSFLLILSPSLLPPPSSIQVTPQSTVFWWALIAVK